MSTVIGVLHRRAIEYIRNVSGGDFGVVKIAWFDDDHEPIGSSLRGDLLRGGMIEEVDDERGAKCLKLTDIGRQELPK